MLSLLVRLVFCATFVQHLYNVNKTFEKCCRGKEDLAAAKAEFAVGHVGSIITQPDSEPKWHFYRWYQACGLTTRAYAKALIPAAHLHLLSITSLTA
jgi:quinol-cytochrome oxidoreductase complex cytochrome b subunit